MAGLAGSAARPGGPFLGAPDRRASLRRAGGRGALGAADPSLRVSAGSCAALREGGLAACDPLYPSLPAGAAFTGPCRGRRPCLSHLLARTRVGRPG